MKDEIAAAVVFITRMVKSNSKLSKSQIDSFSDNLTSALLERFRNHWYPENPLKGQAYRCLRINELGARDSVLEQAAIACKLTFADLCLPQEMTLWVDPHEVCCRFGEMRGAYCTVATFRQGALDNRAMTVNIDEALEKHATRSADISSRRPVTTSRTPSPTSGTSPHRASSNFYHNHLNNHTTRFNINAKPFMSKLNPVYSMPGMVHHYDDQVHWAQGAHLITA